MGEHTYYVDRGLYDADLRKALPERCDARKQFLLDAPRCNVCINGDTPSKIHLSDVPDSLMGYATQSVMGIPVDILNRAHEGCVVAECSPSNRMRPELWNGAVLYVDKVLRVVSEHDDDGNDLVVHVSICVDETTDDVEITFRKT